MRGHPPHSTFPNATSICRFWRSATPDKCRREVIPIIESPVCQDPSFAILLIAYAWDDAPVTVADVVFDGVPGEVIKALTDPEITKVAHNVAFERTCFRRVLHAPMPIDQWEDTMVLTMYNGLPASLDGCAQALGLEAQKDKAGEALIRFFSSPGPDGRRMPEKTLIPGR